MASIRSLGAVCPEASDQRVKVLGLLQGELAAAAGEGDRLAGRDVGVELQRGGARDRLRSSSVIPLPKSSVPELTSIGRVFAAVESIVTVSPLEISIAPLLVNVVVSIVSMPPLEAAVIVPSLVKELPTMTRAPPLAVWLIFP